MKRVYADFNATGIVEHDHYDMVTQILKKVDGNPSSIHHHGREAKIALEAARNELGKLLNVGSQQIVFTSGATEANNLAIQGVVCKHARNNTLPHVIMTGTEHSSVKTTIELLQERGLCEVTIAPVYQNGVVIEDELIKAIKPSTVLICMIHVNNEVGTINPVRELATAIKEKNSDTHIHVDGVQALGKIDLTWLKASAIDSFSASNHKVCGYKGIGLLYLKSGTTLNTLICGGGQERSRRAGTENLPGIISFGLRAKYLNSNPSWLDHLPTLKDKMMSELQKIEGLVLHTDPEKSIPSTFNFHINGIAGEDIMLNFDLAGISVSSGSACASGAQRPSSVLKAMGYSDWEALNSTRISFGPNNSLEDVDTIITTLKQVIERAKKYRK